jgi:hypothetical protein
MEGAALVITAQFMLLDGGDILIKERRWMIIRQGIRQYALFFLLK